MAIEIIGIAGVVTPVFSVVVAVAAAGDGVAGEAARHAADDRAADAVRGQATDGGAADRAQRGAGVMAVAAAGIREGRAGAQGQRLGGGQTDHHPADQARSGRGGDAVHLAQGQPGIGQGPFDHRIQDFQMGAGRDFRHHPAIGRMGLGLAEDDVGQDLARAGGRPAHHRRRGFIAAGLDAQNRPILA